MTNLLKFRVEKEEILTWEKDDEFDPRGASCTSLVSKALGEDEPETEMYFEFTDNQ